MRVAIIGIGGVGGYLGGALLKSGCDVSFIARGEHLAAIKKDGLQVQSTELGDFVARPAIATDDASEIGPVDAVIVAVKGYSLQEAAQKIAPIVSENTIVLPILNGVGMGERLAALLGKGQVVDGCIYIASMVDGPGKVRQFGVKVRIVMGCEDRPVDSNKLEQFAQCLRGAGIEVESGGDVQRGIWTKYTFICSFGCVTACYGGDAGQLREDAAMLEEYKAVCREIVTIAEKKGINIEGAYEEAVNSAMNIVPNTTSSLQRDCAIPGKPNESEQFCAHVERLGVECGVPTPVSSKLAAIIREKCCK